MGAACCIGSAAGSTTFDGSFLSAAAGLFFAHTQGVLSPWSVGMALLLGAVIMYVALILATPKEVQMTAAECTYITAEEPNDPTPLPRLTEEPTVQLTVVVPMYNEAKRLGSRLDDALTWLESVRKSGEPLAQPAPQALPNYVTTPAAEAAAPLTQPLRTYEVLLVDDGSQDRTCEVAMTYAHEHPLAPGAEVRLTRMHYNRGKGAAVRHGVMHARGAFILFADADGATRFSDLAKVAREMSRILTPMGQGIVVGSRAHLVTSEAVVKRSFLRNLLMRCFHVILSVLMRPPSIATIWPRVVPSGAKVQRLPQQPEILDTQCGFKLFSRATAQLLFPLAHIDRWIFDVELLLLAEMACRVSEAQHVLRPESQRGDGHDTLLRLPLPISEVAVHWTEIDGSKIHLLSDSMRMGRDLIVIRLNYWLGRWRSPPSIYARL